MNQDKKQKSFFQHKRVIAVTIITLILAACITYKIIVTDNLMFAENIGAINAQLFMDSFKLPIGIVAAGLSILLLLATQHRSEQTTEQIKLTNEANKNSLAQNTLRNYYDSIADFEKYIKESYHSEIIEIKNIRQLYKLFFPENSHLSVSPYTTIKTYKKNVNSFLELVNQNIKTNKKYNENVIDTFEAIITNFISIAKNRYGVNIKDEAFNIVKASPVNDFLKVTDEVRGLLDFCMDYTPSNGLVIIGNSRVCHLDEWIDFDSEKNDLKTISYGVSLDKRVNLRFSNGRIMFDESITS